MDTRRSWWQAGGSGLAAAPPLPDYAEVVVVGGGLLGASAAHWLALAGLHPLLLESGSLAEGASGRNAGMLVPGLAAPYPYTVAVLGHEAARDLHLLTVENLGFVSELVEKEGIDCGLTPRGHLTLGLGEEQCDMGRMLAGLLAGDGFAVRVVEREELGEFISTPVADLVGGGLLQGDAAGVDPARLVAGVGAAARGHGAGLVTGVRVRAVARSGHRIRLETSAGDLDCGALVLAVNAWTPALVPEVAGLVTPARAQMLAYAPSAPVFHVPCAAALSETGEYWRQLPGGEILVGGRRDLDEGHVTTEQLPTEPVQAAVEQVLPELFPALGPALESVPVTNRWAGAMAATPDGLPIADAVPGLPDAWFAAGCNGHGLSLAVLLGRSLAQAVVDGRAPDALSLFSLHRPTLQDQ